MSYRVNFKDKSSVLVSTERGDKLRQLLLSTDQPSLPIDISGEIYRLYDIASIKKATADDDRMPIKSIDRLISQGKQCKAQFSIQREINRIAKDVSDTECKENPEGLYWGKYIGNRAWRDKMRTELRNQKGVLWCDYKAKECACD